MKYRTIGSATARLDISSVCLGALPFGAVVDEPTSFDILDRFVEAGARCATPAVWDGPGMRWFRCVSGSQSV
jgi:hypothetical protein